MAYKDAWLRSIEEYNSFGICAMDSKHRIDKIQAGLMFGFKVGFSKCITLEIEPNYTSPAVE